MDIILYMACTGMFLSLLTLFHNKGYKSANRYLAGFLFFGSFFVLTYGNILFSKNPVILALLSMGFPALFLLVGPFLFFYIRSILRDNTRLNRWDYLHFAPFVYILLGILPYAFFTDWAYKLKVGAAIVENWHNLPAKFPNPNRLISPYWNERLRIVHGLLYAVLCWGLLFRYRANLFYNSKKSPHVRLIKRWIVLLCLMFSLLMAIRAVQGYYMLTIKNKDQFFQVSSDLILICGVGYVLLNIALLLFPHIFYGLPVLLEGIRLEEGSSSSLHKTGEAEADRSEAKYNGPYPASTASFYRDKVENALTLWIGTKVYVSKDVSLHELSIAIDIPAHHLSYYFNQVLQQRFTDWKNKLKIEYACARIQEGALQKQTIESLAMECGFNSKPTFNRAFRELTGQTPSAYAEKIDSGS